MVKKCAICGKIIEVEDKKIDGTIIKVKEMNGKNRFVYVCSDCQKKDNWIEIAVIRAA